MKSALTETWEIHNRINLYLLDGIEEDAHLLSKAGAQGRTVGEQFAHLHNVRLMWIKASTPELLGSLEKIESKDAVTCDLLKSNLISSGKAITLLLEKGVQENRIKGFKPHPTGFLGYLISHESHHRGQITLSLKQSGFPISKKMGYGMWEWGAR